jgi:uncharacterized protein YyaL (SSP411 family)
MANALAEETSPYLRQHAGNPVDWLPWGPEALARARAEDKPLLVSIGYSSCHWCHVMERESFEDPRTAALMNEAFVCVKVDREERPDVDALYMEAVQGMTGSGGWPLNVFLTPEQLPFYGGTYFPPDPRPGMPAWTQVLQAIAESWSERREEIRAGGERLRERLSSGALLGPSSEPITDAGLDAAVGRLRESFDWAHGGFGRAPKFPHASVIEFLLLRGESEMALTTLRAMAAGGIHDQLGGGFARYSVDDRWAVPHFEKMLYDNGLLARAYLHGWQASGEPRLLEVCLDTLGWALREMRGPEGGFYSALDADSEGVEGRFYVWTVAQLREVLGADADAAIAWFGATEEGNFQDPHNPEPGLNVLQDRSAAPAQGPVRAGAGLAAPRDGVVPLPDAAARRRIRGCLLQARSARARPGLDDKRLTAWNALMITALAETGARLRDDPPAHLPSGTIEAGSTETDAAETGSAETGSAETGSTEIGSTETGSAETDSAETGSTETGGAETGAAETLTAEALLNAAGECAEFLLREVTDERGRLLRTYSQGQAKIDAYLEDYAFLLEAMIALFEATCDERWLQRATGLADEIIARFADPERGGFFSTSGEHEALIARRKEIDDTPIPSGGSSAALGLLRLAQLTGEREYERHAVSVLRLLHEIASRHPLAFGHLLQAIHWHLSPARPVACSLAPSSEGARLAVGRVGGDTVDAKPPSLLAGEVVEVLLHRLRQLVALFDPLEAGLQQHGEGEVRVAGRIRAAQLHPRGLLAAGVIQRHPHQRGAVAARPGDVHGRLEARHKPLVGVHPLGEDRAGLARVLELAGDERLAHVGEEVLVVGVVEGVLAAAEQRLVGVHA